VLWQAKRDAKLLRERQQRSASELDGCTFHPVVNKPRPSSSASAAASSRAESPPPVTAEEAIKAARVAATAAHAVKAKVPHTLRLTFLTTRFDSTL
jgi:hypothetical protein